VKPIAKQLIERFGTVSGALAAPPARLMEISGIGETTAAYIRATNLLLQQTAKDAVHDRPVISNWAALLNYVSLKIKHEKTEQARVLYLDRKNKLIADEKAGQGTVDHAPVNPRQIAAARWSSRPPPSSWSKTTPAATLPRPARTSISHAHSPRWRSRSRTISS
jgi:DNA repair protein RadC